MHKQCSTFKNVLNLRYLFFVIYLIFPKIKVMIIFKHFFVISIPSKTLVTSSQYVRKLAIFALLYCMARLKLDLRIIQICTLALAGKFKKWSKNLGSVLKRCEYDVRSTKKNLGSIGGSLEEPQPKHVHWYLAQRFAHCMSFASWGVGRQNYKLLLCDIISLFFWL